MDTRDRRLAPTVGIVACALVVAALAAPYFVADAGAAGGNGTAAPGGGAGALVSAYYGAGAITPLASGILALIGVIVFAAGREDRTDPGLAAGVTLVLGVVAFAVALSWALTLPADLLVGSEKNAFWTVHRWVVVVGGAGMAVAAGWYARALGLL